MSEGLSNTAFNHTVLTTASCAAVWQLWIDTDSWGRWDLGLKSASTPAKLLSADARGEIVSLNGQRAHFRVTEWQDGLAYAFETALPLAKLTVRRSFEPGPDTRFTHAVRFSGPLSSLWGLVLGRGFRSALVPTMNRLAQLAEGRP